MNTMVDYDTAVATVQNPNADPVMLAKIAYENPDFGANVAVNPRAYPGLRHWLAQFGDNRARQTLKAMGFDVPQRGVSPRRADAQAASPQNLYQTKNQGQPQAASQGQRQSQTAFQDVDQRPYRNQTQGPTPDQASPTVDPSCPSANTSSLAANQRQKPVLGYPTDRQEVQNQYTDAGQYNPGHDSQSDSRSAASTNRHPQQASTTTNAYGYTAEQALDPNTDQMTIAKIAQYAPDLRPCLARNPNTYPELLEWLARLHNPAIDAALATRQ